MGAGKNILTLEGENTPEGQLPDGFEWVAPDTPPGSTNKTIWRFPVKTYAMYVCTIKNITPRAMLSIHPRIQLNGIQVCVAKEPYSFDSCSVLVKPGDIISGSDMTPLEDIVCQIREFPLGTIL